MKNISPSWIWRQQHGPEKLGQCHVSPLLLMTVSKHLATEETSCWTSGRGTLSHSCLINISIYWTVKHQMFSVGVSTMKPCCCNACSVWFSIVVLNYARLSLKKTSEWEHILLWNISAPMVLQMFTLPAPWARMHPHPTRDADFWIEHW